MAAMGSAVDQSSELVECETLIRRKTVGARGTDLASVAILLLIEDSRSHSCCQEKAKTCLMATGWRNATSGRMETR